MFLALQKSKLLVEPENQHESRQAEKRRRLIATYCCSAS
jgi:hypothetical protein